MKLKLEEFNEAQEEIFDFFSIENEYFLKVDLKSKWSIEEVEGVCFLKYWNGEKEETNVVVKSGNKALISQKKGYTMVVSVDCIKIAMVFSNKNKINSAKN